MPESSRIPQADWWRDAVVYQVYPRSFADANNDGTGDVRGITSRLDHLSTLGVDAVWISPWYPSPLADGGYDVADHCDIHPDFGTVADADELIAAAHARGLRVLLDLVPNHTSDEHPWFQAALVSAPGSPERARYVFRDGRGPGGDLPPNNWPSLFGGSAWQRVTEADGTLGQWYLHLFAVKQPDLDWANPEVSDLIVEVLRFWFDRGIDGFRVDVADSLAKHQDFPDTPLDPDTGFGTWRQAPGMPMWDQPELEAIQRRWREVADAYDPPRIYVAESNSPSKFRYLEAGRLHSAFTFDGLACEWDATSLRHMITHSLTTHAAAGAPATWVLGNHDTPRPVTRYGKAFTGWGFLPDGPDPERLVFSEWMYPWPTDATRGRRRARAALLLQAALPGSLYIYQGEELGLEEVEDLPVASLQDPIFRGSNGRHRGRDGCRVPLPWSGTEPPFGFSRDAASWLPQPARWAGRTASDQDADPDSVLALYRTTLALRRELGLGRGDLAWVDDLPHGVLGFTRDAGVTCLVNVGSDAPFPLPRGRVLLASGPLADGALPPDTAVWLAR